MQTCCLQGMQHISAYAMVYFLQATADPQTLQLRCRICKLTSNTEYLVSVQKLLSKQDVPAKSRSGACIPCSCSETFVDIHMLAGFIVCTSTELCFPKCTFTQHDLRPIRQLLPKWTLNMMINTCSLHTQWHSLSYVVPRQRCCISCMGRPREAAQMCNENK